MTGTFGQDLWEPAVATDSGKTPGIRVAEYKLFDVAESRLAETLSKAPLEFTEAAMTSRVELAVPKPDGTLERFAIVNSPIMEAELAAKFPEIQTYAGQGIDDPAAKIRLDLTPAGFHAQVLSPSGAYYIDPYYHLDTSLYASYFVAGQTRPAFDMMEPIQLGTTRVTTMDTSTSSASNVSGEEPVSGSNLAGRTGSELRIYRAAVAANGEYTQFHGGTVQLGQAAVVTAMNRVTGIYESELSIRMRLVANNDQLVYTDPANDPYTNNNPFLLLSENQANVDRIIGDRNYDIGHVFTTGGGGVAGLGVVGISGAKGQGVTGLPSPIGDPFYVDYVAHEMGHQFGGNHTFNGVFGSCGPSRNPGTAYEPGSGTTIQAYAGICGPDDLAPNSDPYFHSVSLDEMLNHVDNVIPTVGLRVPTGNAIPTVSAGRSYVIPARTPFRLTASGADDDATDVLTYSWDQRDLGPAAPVQSPDTGNGPLFRFVPPTTSPTRYFPRLADVVNQTTTIGEQLPQTTRSLNFRATVRDNRANGGGVNTDDTFLSVVDTGTAFRVLSPNSPVTWDGLTFQDVTWDVASTNAGSINAQTVSIYFSTDGGRSFPTLVASGVPNDGLESIVVPNIATTSGRLMVAADDNVFFNVNFGAITVVPVPLQIVLDPGAASYTENSDPIQVSPNAELIDLRGTDFTGLVLTASIAQGGDIDDRLSLLPEGNGPGQVNVTGNQVRFEGTVIGTIANPTLNSLAVTLNGRATAASVQAILRRLGFSSISDAPAAAARLLVVSFAPGLSASRAIGVVQVNDSPAMSSASLPTIDEDVLIPAGRAADAVIGSNFVDPDANSALGGVAVVSNPEIASEGTWYFSSDRGGSWTSVGPVDDALNSLLLSPVTWLGFLPAPNYFGVPQPLQVRVLDNTFTGVFSSSVGDLRRYLNPAARFPDGPVAPVVGSIGVTIRNINDPPIAGPAVLVDGTQDQRLNFALPQNTFTDIDSPNLTYALRPVSTTSLPGWLSLDNATGALTGTPRNEDVGVFEFLLTATDNEGAQASVPLTINIANVNDPPEQLDLRGRTLRENDLSAKIGDVGVFDPDFLDQITLTVSDPRFVVRDRVLYLRANTIIDYETEQRISFTISARDNGSPVQTTTGIFEIEVLDQNEFFPDLRPQDLTIPLNRNDNHLITTLRAPDLDFGQTVKFSIQKDDAGVFTIGETSGELRLRPGAIVDKPSYSVFVRAYDNGTPVNSRVVQFNVQVEVANRFTPQIFVGQTFTIAENALGGTRLGRVLAQDGDGDANLTFSTAGNSGLFTVNATTGELSLSIGSRLDFEQTRSYVLPVQVSDSGSPSRSSTGNVTIAVVNVNEPPTAIAVSDAKIPAQQKGFVLPPLSVTDEDPALQYTFSTTDSRFEVRNGRLALRTSFGFAAADAGLLSVVNVTVTDANDPNSFAILPLSFSVTANPTPWQNPINRFDVNRDGAITRVDALLVVNALSSTLRGPLSVPRELAQLALLDLDVSGDNQLTPLDATQLLSVLASQPGASGEGESFGADSLSNADVWLQAFDSLEADKRRRLSL